MSGGEGTTYMDDLHGGGEMRNRGHCKIHSPSHPQILDVSNNRRALHSAGVLDTDCTLIIGVSEEVVGNGSHEPVSLEVSAVHVLKGVCPQPLVRSARDVVFLRGRKRARLADVDILESVARDGVDEGLVDSRINDIGSARGKKAWVK